MLRVILIGTAMAIAAIAAAEPVSAADDVARGKYLVGVISCNDCHTPGALLGQPDMKRFLGGSNVGFEIPNLGVFYGPNLTPDKATGLGAWSKKEIVTAIRTGKRPDGRALAPIMPWHAFAGLTDRDAYAVAAYLKSLPPVSNKVPGPFGPNQKPTSFFMRVIPPDAK